MLSFSSRCPSISSVEPVEHARGVRARVVAAAGAAFGRGGAGDEPAVAERAERLPQRLRGRVPAVVAEQPAGHRHPLRSRSRRGPSVAVSRPAGAGRGSPRCGTFGPLLPDDRRWSRRDHRPWTDSSDDQEAVMKALVYYGPGKRSWEDVPDPEVTDPEDAIVRVDAVTICGTDLHILKGDVPEVQPGRVLGHEAVGTVTAVGSGVRTVQAGRPRADLVHHRLRPLPVLPRGPLRPVPGRRRLGARAPDRRRPGRVRPGPVRRRLGAPAARRGPRRGRAHARRHPAHRPTRSERSTAASARATRSSSSAPDRSGWPPS